MKWKERQDPGKAFNAAGFPTTSDLRFELASYEGEYQPSDEEPDVDNLQDEDNSQDD